MDNFSDSYIKIRNLKIKYFRKSEIALNIRKGEIVAITGDSGSGKSLLLKYLGGVIRPEQNGVIRVGELDLYNEIDIYKYHRQCSIAFQNPEDNLIFDNLEADIRFGYENIGKTFDEKEFLDSLKPFNIAGKASISYSELSAGELGRVALYSSLIFDPDIILFDEAFSMQDRSFSERIFMEMIRKAKEEKKTFIFVSHSDREIEQADRIIEMKQGDIVSDFSTVAASPMKQEGIDRILKNMEPEAEPVVIRGADGKLIYIDSFVFPNSEEGSPVIRLKDVSFFHRRRKTRLHIVQDFSYDFISGRLYVISGRSGAGKTTFLKLLNGLIHAKKGNVYAFGKKFPGYGRNGWLKIKDDNHVAYLNRLRKRIGYVGQFPDGQLIPGKIIDDVMYGPINFGSDSSKARNQARLALRTMQLDEELWNMNTDTLSYGQKNRVAVAGAIASEPDVLLMDMPFEGLDLTGEKLMATLISEYITAGKTVIITEVVDDTAR
ncbi:MAG: ATP-binding cassette domain-containing protein [Eubacterium sp.]|nr:ATP-binding cassette domain-containing protein [Eubacterium sp.]